MSNIWQNKGLTLLEVLVAMALLIILSAALYGTYFSLLRGRETAAATMEARRELSTTLDRLRRELSSAYYNTQNPRLRFKVEDRDYFGKPASTLDFTFIAPPGIGQQPGSDQVEAVYKAEEKDKKLILARQEKDIYFTADPVPYPQMENLEGFLVECSSDGAKWVKTYDVKLNANRLPKYVRVTLMVKEGEKTVEFSTVAAIRVRS